MKVILPKPCIGEQIVKAFKAASTYQEARTKWEPKEDAVNQYIPGSARQTVRKLGLKVRQYSLEKKWLLFGPRIWRRIPCPVFRLESMFPSQTYIEIDVEILDVPMPYRRDATDQEALEFDEIRQPFEKILGRFFSILTQTA
jgi:hypothetical protein